MLVVMEHELVDAANQRPATALSYCWLRTIPVAAKPSTAHYEPLPHLAHIGSLAYIFIPLLD